MDPMLLLMLGLLGVPVAGAILSGISRPRAAPVIAVIASLLAAGIGVQVVLQGYPDGASFRLGGLPWLPGQAGTGVFGLSINPLSSIMVLVITVIGFLIVLYSTEYLSPRNA